MALSLLFTRPGATPPKPEEKASTKADGKDTWLTIRRVEFFAAKEGAQIRVTANVNGTPYTYPSNAGIEWLEVGSAMSPQTYRLPPIDDQYVIRFEAEVRIPGRRGHPEVKGQLKSVSEDFIKAPLDKPFDGKYVLHTFDPIHHARSAEATAELIYRIASDPQ